MRELGAFDNDQESFKSQLYSLTIARNCLMHDAGFISSDRVGGADALEMSWSYFGTFLETPDGDIPFDRDNPAPPVYDIEIPVFLRLAVRERRFEMGGHVNLEPHDQMEICMFYNLLVEKVIAALCDEMRKAGVLFDEASSDQVNNE